MNPEQECEKTEKIIIWDRQPLGLMLYGFLMIALTAPGLIALDIAIPVFKLGTLGWSIGSEASMAFGALVALIGMTCVFCKRSISTLPFKVRGCVTETLAGYLIGAALISVAVNLLAVTGHLHYVAGKGRYNAFLAILFCFFIALFEETFFRGYMLPAFERRWGTFAALIASSLIFGAMHIMNIPGKEFSLQLRVAIFLALEAGLPLAGAYLATRRLWMPIGLHWAWNFFEGPIYGVIVSGTSDFESKRTGVLTGASWITGGSFGPEAGVFTLITGTLAGAALLIAAARAGNWKPAPSSLFRKN